MQDDNFNTFGRGSLPKRWPSNGFDGDLIFMNACSGGGTPDKLSQPKRSLALNPGRARVAPQRNKKRRLKRRF
jgi:hypothetical protein